MLFAEHDVLEEHDEVGLDMSAAAAAEDDELFTFAVGSLSLGTCINCPCRHLKYSFYKILILLQHPVIPSLAVYLPWQICHHFHLRHLASFRFLNQHI